MNRIESVVYNFVKHNPRMKNRVRDLYQLLMSLIPVKNEEAAYPVIAREGYFFGFHDKCPWSSDGKFLLAHAYNHLSNADPRVNDQTDIGYFNGDESGDFTRLASTSCFNWQQGSMLQWVGKEKLFIFNDVKEGELVARIFDVQGKEMDVLPLPVSAVSADGIHALSYNFPRLQKYFPGYGYLHGTDSEADIPMPDHGISLVNIKLNSVRKLFSVKDIAGFSPEPGMKEGFHFLTHCLFSPAGNRFLFLHRWIVNMNYVHTRLFSCDVHVGNLHLFPAKEMVSHISWQDEHHVLAYCRTGNRKDAYVLFEDMSDQFRVIGSKDFTSDGHPSFMENNDRWFITDTYPDRFRRSTLILYDLKHEKRYNLGYFRQPAGFTETVRCDLHPRWNRQGTMICFDSAHTGKRSLCTMNLGDVIRMENINPL